jgi:hypothetical protein
VSDDTTAAALSSSLVEYLEPTADFIGSMTVTPRRSTLVRLSKCPPAWARNPHADSEGRLCYLA